MNKLVFALVGLGCILVAECNKDFHEEWKARMKADFCEGGNSEAHMKCASLMPQGIAEYVKAVTGKDEMAETMQVLCDDDSLLEKVCQHVRENKDKLGLDDITIRKMRECFMATS